MIDSENLDFGMEVVMEYLEDEQYVIYDASLDTILPANIVASKDNTTYCIKDNVSVEPIMPTLSEPEQIMSLNYTEENKAEAYFAPVQICSRDKKRKAAGPALCGDNFMIRFSGLEKL